MGPSSFASTQQARIRKKDRPILLLLLTTASKASTTGNKRSVDSQTIVQTGVFIQGKVVELRSSFNVIQCHRNWYQLKAPVRLPISRPS